LTPVSGAAGNCAGPSFTISVIVNPLPVITSTTTAVRCDAGTLSLSAVASVGTVKWYDAATGGNLVGTGTSLTTPVIAVTTTYYAEATNSGCTSARTPVVATINKPVTITTQPATARLCPAPFSTLSTTFTVA